MAEIKIEKKSPIWPWILLLIAVIAMAVYFVYYNNSFNENNKVENESRDTISNSYEHPSTVPHMEFNTVVQEFTSSIADSTRIGMDATYTKTAIINLAKVVTLKAEEANLQSSNALENLKTYSNQMDGTKASEVNKNSMMEENFKTVFNDIVLVLESIQTQSYPSLKNEVSELKQTSNNIDNKVAIKEQQNTIQAFFIKARTVVNNMNS